MGSRYISLLNAVNMSRTSVGPLWLLEENVMYISGFIIFLLVVGFLIYGWNKNKEIEELKDEIHQLKKKYENRLEEDA